MSIDGIRMHIDYNGNLPNRRGLNGSLECNGRYALFILPSYGMKYIRNLIGFSCRSNVFSVTYNFQ